MTPNTPLRGRPAGGPVPTRRALLRTAFTTAVVAGTGGVLAPVVLRGHGTATRDPERDDVGPERFSERYKGREIRGKVTPAAPGGAQPHAAAAGAVAARPEADVRIDGRTLHVMRRADGSYLSAVNHYESYPTLLETARAAVDELGGAQLSAAPSHAI